MKIKTYLLLGFIIVLSSCNLLLRPTEQQIKEDLIGNTVGDVFFSWRFDSLDEFEDFEIVETKASGNLIEYKVYVVLRDLTYNYKASANLVINYRREGGEWQMVNVTDWHSLKRIN